MRFATKPTISVLLAAGWSVLGTSAHADILHVPGDFPTIQAAIDAAMDGDEVEVHPGTYGENINFLGKAITVRSTDPTDPAVVVSTIIDGGGSGSVVTCTSGEGSGSVLSGFVITGGNATLGGGMFNNLGSSPTVSNCTFSGNLSNQGGGMSNFNSSNPTVSNCTFSGNTAGFGGGMYNGSSSPTVTNCTFSGNTAGFSGGGMSNGSSSPTLTNCTVCGNTPDTISGPFTDGGGNFIGPHCPPPIPPAAPCPADFNSSGDVDAFDLAQLLGSWGLCP